MNTLATIGYEGAEVDDFIDTLKVTGITSLIDVRQIAGSRRKGFSKTALKSSLESSGIEYFHLAGLGDPKEGRDAMRAGQVEKFLKVFNAHMETDRFNSDLEQAIAIIVAGNACLLCYERHHKSCHRTIVAERISDSINTKVTHLGVERGISQNGSRIRPRTRPGAGEGVTASK